MISYLQKIGRALMVPVAILPAAAILMGFGYWVDPTGWGANSVVAAILIKSGAAIIDNMSVLFAIGVAYGLSTDKDGAAALTGYVAFAVVTTLLSPGAVAQIQHITDPSLVPPAFGKINNQFVGILSGVIAAEIYNRTKGVELHSALAFFSGRRLAPIVTSIVMIFVSAILLFVWPVIYNALVQFGEAIQHQGAVGAGIYGFFNRLLIPIGLHHALNSVFWFDVAGINDIPNFLGGAKSIADGKGIVGITGMYQAGFFPIMMFGLPGAALAIYHTSKSKNKAKVASIMLAAALSSFFTGVTEPIEFAFMFVAPVLYVFHAFLTGISVYIAASMHWMAGFGFSAGFVDMFLSSHNPLATHWYMLIVQGLAFFVIYYVSFKLLILKLNLKTPGREDDSIDAPIAYDNTSSKKDHASVAAAVLQYIGGHDNLVNVDNCATRLRLEVKDSHLVDIAALKQHTSGVIIPSEKTAQIIIGPHVQFVADALKALTHK